MGRSTNSYAPFWLVFCVRVRLVPSATRVTTASGTAPPEASVTVPVIPPRVCWAWAIGVKAIAVNNKKRNETRERGKDLLWLLRIGYNLRQRRDALTEFHPTLVQALFFGHAGFGSSSSAFRKTKIIAPILVQISLGLVEIFFCYHELFLSIPQLFHT